VAFGLVGLNVAALFFWAVGLDPRLLLDGTVSSPGPPLDQVGSFVAHVLGSTEARWREIFAADGQTYRPPVLVLYRETTYASCGGTARSIFGPFYCQEDQKIYLDTSFFDEITSRFQGCDLGATACQFSYAYVIAHEIGHHVQNLLGILPKAQQLQRTASSQAAANHIQVLVELQADCLAGVWANRENEASRSQGVEFLSPPDIEAATQTAAALGNDRLQRQNTGREVPDSFTHGSSEQRVRWLSTGMRSGMISSCNTFKAQQP
jgi:predicted metalloprotease